MDTEKSATAHKWMSKKRPVLGKMRSRGRLGLSALMTLLVFAQSCSKQPNSSHQSNALDACSSCQLPNVCLYGQCQAPGTPAITAAFGSGPGRLNMMVGNKGATIAPMSFAVRDDGLIIVLDQGNGRLQAFRDGKADFSVRLDSSTYSDVAFFDHERLVLLDLQHRGKVVLMTLDGQIQTQTEVVGTGVEEAGLAGPLLVRGDGVWLKNGRRSIRYLTASGELDPKRQSVANHLVADEEHLATVLVGDHTATVQKIKRKGLLDPVVAYREYTEPLWAETSVDSDANGKLYVQIQKRQPNGAHVRLLEVLDASMKWERSVILPDVAVHGDADVFRPLVVTPKGEIYWMYWTSNEFQLLRY